MSIPPMQAVLHANQSFQSENRLVSLSNYISDDTAVSVDDRLISPIIRIYKCTNAALHLTSDEVDDLYRNQFGGCPDLINTKIR